MRLFVGIDIDETIRQRISQFMESVRDAAPKARWVKPETFHITLKFLGETQKDQEIKKALEQVQKPGVAVRFAGSGFFPAAKSARVLWVGIEADDRLPALAAAVDAVASSVGFAHEVQRRFTPHLTLARAGSRSSGNPHQKSSPRDTVFGALQGRLESLPQPDFGTMQAREFFLYESTLSPAGARYRKIARYPLE
jgi:2'-5' RNA ligase